MGKERTGVAGIKSWASCSTCESDHRTHDGHMMGILLSITWVWQHYCPLPTAHLPTLPQPTDYRLQVMPSIDDASVIIVSVPLASFT